MGSNGTDRVGMISIHAPLTGSDQGPSLWPGSSVDFNPRSPYGERPAGNLAPADLPDFNPRSPYGERPWSVPSSGEWRTFQSTLPLRGATCPAKSAETGVWISIHAPLTGSDWGMLCPIKNYINFNPRSPYGERLNPDRGYPRALAISIHAPLTGSDGLHARGKAGQGNFNPRSPYGERLYGDDRK